MTDSMQQIESIARYYPGNSTTNNFASAIYNHRTGTHDAIAFGETKNAGVRLNQEIKTMATKKKAKKTVAKKKKK
jgi:hypothetical protein